MAASLMNDSWNKQSRTNSELPRIIFRLLLEQYLVITAVKLDSTIQSMNGLIFG